MQTAWYEYLDKGYKKRNSPVLKEMIAVFVSTEAFSSSLRMG